MMVLLGYDGSESSYSVSWQTSGDVVGVKIDLDNSTIGFFVNGVYQGDAKTDLPSFTYHPFVYNRAGAPAASELRLNFGQKPFKFSPPDGYQVLNAANTRPVKVISRPDQYVGVTTYTGDGGASKSISGLNFREKPDLVWVKEEVIVSHIYCMIRCVALDQLNHLFLTVTTLKAVRGIMLLTVMYHL